MSELPQFSISGNNCTGLEFPELNFHCPANQTEDEHLFNAHLQKRDRIDSEELWEDQVVVKRRTSEAANLDIKFPCLTRAIDTGLPAKPDQQNTFNEFFVG